MKLVEGAIHAAAFGCGIWLGSLIPVGSLHLVSQPFAAAILGALSFYFAWFQRGRAA